MRAPEFWECGRGGAAAALLGPVAALYGRAQRARRARAAPFRPPVPVVCVGNAVAGGAGKTPVAIDVGARIKRRGIDAHFLTRGYGGGQAGPLLVAPARHGHREVGDEALLLSAVASTWVGSDRAAAARAAVAAGAQALVMDDGYQNPGLAKDVSLLVVDGAYGFGNGRLIPAGPLREPLADALARATAVVFIGADEKGVAKRLGPLPVLAARYRPGPEAETLAGARVVAFAGIARPQKFFATLAEIGCEIASARSFADHHPFTASEIAALEAEAARRRARLVTTAKDAARLPPDTRKRVAVVTIALEWAEEAAIDALLDDLVSHGR